MRSSMAPTFEIRIAVLGYVSAGKTTVINALLRDKYGQVGMRRTTAGVNYFRLHFQHQPGGGGSVKKIPDASAGGSQQHDNTTKKLAEVDEEEDWSLASSEDGGFVAPAETLREISDDNTSLRESSTVHVKSFDISISEPLCTEVRTDTRLVLVDIPGINEAGASGKYRAYVRDHWDTFDCAIVVMDGRHGANTEEHVDLLKFVRDNNKTTKNIPVIVVCNKVDDPDDLEQAELVKEAKEEVERIFQGQSKSPKFVPTSAEFAYIYRTAALMSPEQFLSFDKDLIDRLGRKEVGWKFSKYSTEEKFRMAYEFVSDAGLYDDRIQVTNFNMVLQAIEEAVGGSDTQIQLVQSQIDVALRGLSHESGYVEKIRGVFGKRLGLGQSTDDLPTHFWETIRTSEDAAFRQFDASPALVKCLAKPLDELIDYYALATAQKLDSEQAKCVTWFEGFVARQIGTLLSKSTEAPTDWVIRARDGEVNWLSLLPVDWLRACQSLLLLSYDKTFCETFGREAMLLEDCKHKWMSTAASTDPSCFGDCPQCKAPVLNFNGYCSACTNFVAPIECAALKEIVHGQKICGKCLRESCSGYQYSCTRYNSSSDPAATTVGFVVSTSANRHYVDVPCPGGCTELLNANRFCATCKAMYCLKGHRQCISCNSQLKSGVCSNKYCGARKLTWKELPYASLLELFVHEYDKVANDIKPKYEKIVKSYSRLDVPARPSDPSHFGHVAWKYCQFVKSQPGTI